MILRDWICDVCGHKKLDRPDTKYPPRHCRKVMRKIYKATPVVWKTPGCTRTVPFPDKEKK